jgi:1,4-dihydroxy-6-naphthoate synthase
MPEDRTLLLGHSPDPDDAFMFYGLAADRIPTPGWRFEHILQDIQTLNERAVRGELHVTAISIHAYPYLADRYALTGCGASMGDRYGPLLVARRDLEPEELIGKTIAVPGEMTTAFLVLNLLLGKGRFGHQVVRFDQILERVASDEFEAGLIIHEGQLTYHKQALVKVVDLGRWWHEQTGLPLPLGGNCIRRDLGADAMREVTAILKRSIEFSLAHREQAVQYALQYARDMGTDLADEFIGMYVNDWTLDYGAVGRRAVTALLSRGAEAGVVPPVGEIDFISGA